MIELVQPKPEAAWMMFYFSEIEFVHHFGERYAGQGGYNEDHEFFGYRDEI